MGLSDRRRRLLGRLARRKSRIRERLVLVEGIRTAEEVIASMRPVRWAACAPALREGERGRRLESALNAAGVSIEPVTDRELAAVSATENPQGVLLVADEPQAPPGLVSGGGRFLAVDGLQDPGNLGTLIRAALAFDLDGVVVLEGTVDPWNPKAVRSAAGASFRVPVAQATWPEVRSWNEEGEIKLLAADAGGRDVASIDPGEGWMLVVGSEGHGLGPQVLDGADVVVSIPMPGGAESLNAGVAGAILLYVLTRDIQHA